MPPDARVSFLASVAAARPDLALLDGLRDCHDVLPDPGCDMLAVTRGSTYAQAAALMRRREQGASPESGSTRHGGGCCPIPGQPA